ncbi:MAG TPA: hypothetical protein VKB14_03990 [Actinomycetales bacterium]|nr:hypothetical protein [Actinomycetales bacterium]
MSDHFQGNGWRRPAPVDAELAAWFGVDLQQFIEVFGCGWRALDDEPHDWDADPTGGEEALFGPWYLSGEPPQLMFRRLDDDAYELAPPKGVWAGGTHGLTYRAVDRRSLPRRDFARAHPDRVIKDILRRRRSQFRYCRYCRALTPPELLTGAAECMSCAATYHGVVF